MDHARAGAPEGLVLQHVRALRDRFVPGFVGGSQVYGPLKTPFRKADACAVEAAWRKISSLLDLFPPDEIARYLRHAG